ncbi:MAG: LysR family transcriptional regulator [Roseiarcus sp.]
MSLPRMSLRKIACFVAAADAGSVSAGARQLSLSQAAMSEALNDLEKELGLDLFIRHKAIGVTLTCAGRQLLVEARRLVREAEEFQALAGGPDMNLTGELVVGCFPTMLSFVAPPLIAGFQTLHPEVTFRFVEDSQFNLEHAMLAGTIDLSIVYDFGLGAALERRRLYDAIAYVLLSPQHRLADSTEPVDLASFGDDPFIQIDVLPGRDEHLFAAVGLTPNVVHRTTNFEFVRALVAHNLGYAVLVQRPKNDVTTEGLPLVVRPIANPVPHLTVSLAWPANLHLHRRVRAFVDFSVETFKDGYHA